jgi:phage terminase large subunit-like protein
MPRLISKTFIGKPCRIGVDLATKVDLAAVALLFEDGDRLVAFPRFYVPEAAIEETRNASYRGWQIEGHIIETPGDVTDFNRLKPIFAPIWNAST